jgi:hypothetical protein
MSLYMSIPDLVRIGNVGWFKDMKKKRFSLTKTTSEGVPDGIVPY